MMMVQTSSTPYQVGSMHEFEENGRTSNGLSNGMGSSMGGILHERLPYEDEIVPALRRRLEEESRNLSKRMSVHSMIPPLESNVGSVVSRDAHAPPLPYRKPDSTAAPSTSNGITRPIEPPPNRRSRTYSTPGWQSGTDTAPQSIPSQQQNALRTTSDTYTQAPPTPRSRIPKPTLRAPSKASQADTPVSESLPTTGHDDLKVSHVGSKRPREPSILPERVAQKRSTPEPNVEEVLGYDDDDDEDYLPNRPTQFEHWYRGEGRGGGGRNGGRGEIRAGTQEMLEIALGGHLNTEYLDRRSWVAQRNSVLDDRDVRLSEDLRPHSEWTEDYVLNEHPLTDMDADTTDVEVSSTTWVPNNHETLSNAQTPKKRAVATNPPKTKTTAKPPPKTLQPKPVSFSKATGRPAAGSIPVPRMTSSASSSPKQRVKKKTSMPSAGAPKSQSRSAYDLSAVSALADAVPHWEVQPPIPPSGNWDEVVLPTIARKMRMAEEGTEPEIAMLGSAQNKSSERNTENTIPPPAPGTFDYDQSKAYAKRDSLEMRQLGLARENGASTPSSSLPRMNTPSQTSVRNQAPNHNYLGPPRDEQSSKRPNVDLRKNKPSIRVTSPSVVSQPTRATDDGDQVGCCKCVIM